MIDVSVMANWAVSVVFSSMLMQDADIVLEPTPTPTPTEQIATAPPVDTQTSDPADLETEGSEDDGIDFGDDTSRYANDGECDDPRFEGEGMAAMPFDADLQHDATDCRAAYNAGTITLIPDDPSPFTSSGAGDIDYGDDTSAFAFDGECDDPRFQGPAVAPGNIPEDEGHDATDCRRAVEEGTASYVGYAAGPAISSIDPGSIDFGDDSSFFANDGECDDPRFEGPGTSGIDNPDYIRTDASDCRNAVNAGTAALKSATDQPSITDIDFGDDSSFFANDGECDDPRFEGEGTSGINNNEYIKADASDCRDAFERGTATLRDSRPGDLDIIEADGIEFGDNSSTFANDGECDDPRFEGEGVAFLPVDENIGRDADDCRAAFEAGTAILTGFPTLSGLDTSPRNQVIDMSGIDFGDDSSDYALDGECDDPRFSGPGTSGLDNRAYLKTDASDCRDAVAAGLATYDGELQPLFAGEADGVDYGDNSSAYATDGECDDPRFEGDAMGFDPIRDNVRRDAHDCRQAVMDGSITYTGELAPLFSGEADGIDFGTNEGTHIDDTLCDDPRFRGPGMSFPPYNANAVSKDASDCHWHHTRGFVEMVTPGDLFTGSYDGIEFGDNSGSYFNDGECDDARFEGPLVAESDEEKTDAADCKIAYERGEIALIAP